ncbi:hypothetical protein D9M68_698510 [compost metagenome]
MQPPRLARPRHLTRPDVQTVVLLAVQLQLFKAFLYPLPIGNLILHGEGGRLRVFSCVALEHARADQKGGVSHGMYQGLGFIDDELAVLDALLQPGYEVFAGRRFLRASAVRAEWMRGGRWWRWIILNRRCGRLTEGDCWWWFSRHLLRGRLGIGGAEQRQQGIDAISGR